MDSNIFNKNCPKCGEQMCYTRKDALKDSIIKNRLCRSCSKKGKQPSYMINGVIPSEILEKMSKTWFAKGHKPTNIEQRKGKTLEEIYGEDKAKEIIEKYKNVIQSEESNEKRSIKSRFYTIKRLNKLNKKFHPPYNPKACEYFNKLMKETDTFIQHAENGGEYYIKDLGFWVDGYDKENNIVYEYDEKHHFKNNVLTDKDIKRQNIITNHLKCGFIRVKD